MGSLTSLSTRIANSYAKSADSTFGGNFPSGTPMQNAEPARQDPRGYQLTSGQNVILKPRSEMPNITPFEVLNFVAKSTDLIQIAENILLNQISGRKWDIVSSDPEDKTDYSKDIAEVKLFFKHPDKERTYSAWIRKLLKNVTRYDTLTIYKRKSKNGKLYGLSIVDGSTIKVVVDSNGNRPIAPIPAYQQIIYGSVRGEWTTDELIYAPMSEELAGNYGLSPVERIIASTLKYLRKQQFDYAYFKDGAYPDGGLYALKPNDQSQWSADDIMKFNAHWLSDMADYTNRQSLKFVPDGTLHKTKEYSWDTVQEEWFGRLVCTSMGIAPNTFAKGVNRAVAETEDRQQTETGLNPYIRHIEDINTDIIQRDMGFPNLSFKMIDEKLEDQQVRVEKNIKYVMAGIYNRNEIRKEEGKEEVEGGNDYTVQVGNALIPLKDVGKMVAVTPETGNTSLETRDIKQDSNHRATTDAKIPGKKSAPQSKEIKKAMGTYKNFLVKRFKENRSLLGYTNPELPEVIIKAVEDQLHNTQSLGDIINIFKSEDDEDSKKKLLIAFIVTMLIQARNRFADSLETFYRVGSVQNIKKFNFINNDEFVKKLNSFILLATEKGRISGIDKVNKLLGHAAITLPPLSDADISTIKLYASTLVEDLNTSTQHFAELSVQALLENSDTVEQARAEILSGSVYAFSPARASIIVNNEELRAVNYGEVGAYKDSKVISKVLVYDGDGCEICSELNGTTQTVEWAEENLLEHPNCIREIFPLIGT